MSIQSGKFESAKVLLPNKAPWLADLETELFTFPHGRHDDQVNSISQALSYERSAYDPRAITEGMGRFSASASPEAHEINRDRSLGLINLTERSADAFIADKAYNTDAIRGGLKQRGFRPVISPKSKRTATIAPQPAFLHLVY